MNSTEEKDVSPKVIENLRTKAKKIGYSLRKLPEKKEKKENPDTKLTGAVYRAGNELLFSKHIDTRDPNFLTKKPSHLKVLLGLNLLTNA